MPRTPAFRSRYCQGTLVLPDLIADTPGFIAALTEFVTEYSPRVILPSGDVTISVLRPYRQHFANLGCIVALGPEPALDVANDKDQTLAVAERLGIAMPATIRLSGLDDLSTAVAELGFPFVLKPTVSNPVGWERLFAVGVINKEEAPIRGRWPCGMSPSRRFRPERRSSSHTYSAGMRDAVRPADARPVLPKPSQVTVEPTGPHAAPVSRHGRHVEAYNRAPDHQREIDASLHGVLDGPGEPRVDFHEQRAVVRVPPELNLACSLQADLACQPHSGIQGVVRCLDALPDHRGSAQWRARAVRDMPAGSTEVLKRFLDAGSGVLAQEWAPGRREGVTLFIKDDEVLAALTPHDTRRTYDRDHQ